MNQYEEVEEIDQRKKARLENLKKARAKASELRKLNVPLKTINASTKELSQIATETTTLDTQVKINELKQERDALINKLKKQKGEDEPPLELKELKPEPKKKVIETSESEEEIHIKKKKPEPKKKVIESSESEEEIHIKKKKPKNIIKKKKKIVYYDDSEDDDDQDDNGIIYRKRQAPTKKKEPNEEEYMLKLRQETDAKYKEQIEKEERALRLAAIRNIMPDFNY